MTLYSQLTDPTIADPTTAAMSDAELIEAFGRAYGYMIFAPDKAGYIQAKGRCDELRPILESRLAAAGLVMTTPSDPQAARDVIQATVRGLFAHLFPGIDPDNDEIEATDAILAALESAGLAVAASGAVMASDTEGEQ